MGLIEVFILALGLALDAFAVSIVTGLALDSPRIGESIRVAISFGFFQAFMPWVGWGVGLGLRECILSIARLVAFGLLCIVGLKLILGSLGRGPMHQERKKLDPAALMLLSLGTSIDALIAGVSLSLLGIPIAIPSLVIGGVTLLLSFGGFLLGRRFGVFLGAKARIAGGIFLIAMGVRVLVGG